MGVVCREKSLGSCHSWGNYPPRPVKTFFRGNFEKRGASLKKSLTLEIGHQYHPGGKIFVRKKIVCRGGIAGVDPLEGGSPDTAFVLKEKDRTLRPETQEGTGYEC